MAETKLLDLIPSSLHQQLFEEVQDALKDQKGVDPSIAAFAEKQKNKKR